MSGRGVEGVAPGGPGLAWVELGWHGLSLGWARVGPGLGLGSRVDARKDPVGGTTGWLISVGGNRKVFSPGGWLFTAKSSRFRAGLALNPP